MRNGGGVRGVFTTIYDPFTNPKNPPSGKAGGAAAQREECMEVRWFGVEQGV